MLISNLPSKSTLNFIDLTYQVLCQKVLEANYKDINGKKKKNTLEEYNLDSDAKTRMQADKN
jgi:hypothetical protein